MPMWFLTNEAAMDPSEMGANVDPVPSSINLKFTNDSEKSDEWSLKSDISTFYGCAGPTDFGFKVNQEGKIVGFDTSLLVKKDWKEDVKDCLDFITDFNFLDKDTKPDDSKNDNQQREWDEGSKETSPTRCSLEMKISLESNQDVVKESPHMSANRVDLRDSSKFEEVPSSKGRTNSFRRKKRIGPKNVENEASTSIVSNEASLPPSCTLHTLKAGKTDAPTAINSISSNTESRSHGATKTTGGKKRFLLFARKKRKSKEGKEKKTLKSSPEPSSSCTLLYLSGQGNKNFKDTEVSVFSGIPNSKKDLLESKMNGTRHKPNAAPLLESSPSSQSTYTNLPKVGKENAVIDLVRKVSAESLVGMNSPNKSVFFRHEEGSQTKPGDYSRRSTVLTSSHFPSERSIDTNLSDKDIIPRTCGESCVQISPCPNGDAILQHQTNNSGSDIIKLDNNEKGSANVESSTKLTRDLPKMIEERKTASSIHRTAAPKRSISVSRHSKATIDSKLSISDDLNDLSPIGRHGKTSSSTWSCISPISTAQSGGDIKSPSSISTTDRTEDGFLEGSSPEDNLPEDNPPEDNSPMRSSAVGAKKGIFKFFARRKRKTKRVARGAALKLPLSTLPHANDISLKEANKIGNSEEDSQSTIQEEIQLPSPSKDKCTTNEVPSQSFSGQDTKSSSSTCLLNPIQSSLSRLHINDDGVIDGGASYDSSFRLNTIKSSSTMSNLSRGSKNDNILHDERRMDKDENGNSLRSLAVSILGNAVGQESVVNEADPDDRIRRKSSSTWSFVSNQSPATSKNKRTFDDEDPDGPAQMYDKPSSSLSTTSCLPRMIKERSFDSKETMQEPIAFPGSLNSDRSVTSSHNEGAIDEGTSKKPGPIDNIISSSQPQIDGEPDERNEKNRHSPIRRKPSSSWSVSPYSQGIDRYMARSNEIQSKPATMMAHSIDSDWSGAALAPDESVIARMSDKLMDKYWYGAAV